MTTVIINTRSTEAKKMVEFLKTTKYAKVVEEKIPNKETLNAMRDVESGKVKSYTSTKNLIESLKKKAGV